MTSRVGPLIENKVDAKIFHRRVEKLLHDLGQTMYLIDEKDIPPFEVGEDTDEVATLLNSWARGRENLGIQLSGNNMGQGCLSETWRGMEKDVV